MMGSGRGFRGSTPVQQPQFSRPETVLSGPPSLNWLGQGCAPKRIPAAILSVSDTPPLGTTTLPLPARGWFRSRDACSTPSRENVSRVNQEPINRTTRKRAPTSEGIAASTSPLDAGPDASARRATSRNIPRIVIGSRNLTSPFARMTNPSVR